MRDSADIYCWACGWRLSHTPRIVPGADQTDDYSDIDHPNKRTSKELAVYQLRADGKSIRVISETLDLEIQTVKNYLTKSRKRELLPAPSLVAHHG